MKAPAKPEESFEKFVREIQEIFGETLNSVCLFGSGARGEYVPGKSDLNFLVIISSDGLKYLDGVWNYAEKWRKRYIATPLILTESYVESSIDSFPLEFLEMKEAHIVVYGEDPFDKIEVVPSFLRLQVERELKAKLLSLRQGYIETAGKEREIRNLILVSLPAFTAIFRGVLHLMKASVAADSTSSVYSLTEETFGIKKGLFEDLQGVRESRVKRSTAELKELMEEYMEGIRKVFKIIDNLE